MIAFMEFPAHIHNVDRGQWAIVNAGRKGEEEG
jgi:hypothetical protein